MKRRWLIALTSLAFLATLVLHAPAALIYARVPQDAGVRLYGLHGTLAAGGFAALAVNQRVVLHDARWDLNPLWLPLLRLSADLEAGGDTVMRARVSRAVFGKLHWSDVDVAGSVRSLLGAAGQALLPVEGQLRLALPSLVLDKGVPVHAEGTAELQGLAWTLARDPLLLGDFNAVLSTDDKGILVTLASGAGPLELSGEARLKAQNDYDLHLQLKPRANAGAQLQVLLRSVGPADAQGWYHIRRQGKL